MQLLGHVALTSPECMVEENGLRKEEGLQVERALMSLLSQQDISEKKYISEAISQPW